MSKLENAITLEYEKKAAFVTLIYIPTIQDYLLENKQH